MKSACIPKTLVLLLAVCGRTFLMAQVLGFFQQPPAFNAAPTAASAVSKTSAHADYPQNELVLTWNAVASNWDSSQQITMTYFPNGGQNVQELAFYSNGTFIPDSRTTYFQDAAGRDTTYLHENHNGTGWENDIRTTFTYDVYGNPLGNWVYVWEAADWDIQNGQRHSYTYDGGNNITTDILETYDAQLQTWGNYAKIEYTYNTQNQCDSRAISYWNANAWRGSYKEKDIVWHDYSARKPLSATLQEYTTQWVDWRRMHVTYANGIETRLEENIIGAAHVNALLEISHYDLHNHLTYTKLATWSAASAWLAQYEYSSIYTYDGLGKTMEIVIREHDSIGIHNTYRRVFSSYFTEAGAAQTLSLDLSVYPNPATEQLHFKLSLAKPSPVSIILYDLQGRKRVETTTTANGQEIVVPIAASLGQGTYIYRVQTKEGHADGKVMIAR